MYVSPGENLNTFDMKREAELRGYDRSRQRRLKSSHGGLKPLQIPSLADAINDTASTSFKIESSVSHDINGVSRVSYYTSAST